MSTVLTVIFDLLHDEMGGVRQRDCQSPRERMRAIERERERDGAEKESA